MARKRTTPTDTYDPTEQVEAEPAPLYDRLPNETDRAWAGFLAYRDLGPNERSLRAVARLLDKKLSTIAPWSQQYQWVARVAAWDRDHARQLAAAQLQDVVRMNKRHADTAQALVGKAVQALAAIEVSKLRPADIARFIEIGARIERLARGEVTERAEHVGPAGGPVQVEVTDPETAAMSGPERLARVLQAMELAGAFAGSPDRPDDEG